MPHHGGRKLSNLVVKARKLTRILQVPLWRIAFRKYGVAASVEHEAVLRLLGPLDLIVDIGANRGQFALLARHCSPSAKILSFEPLPSPSNTYRRVFSGDQRTSLVQCAIGPEQGSVPIHISARDDSSSLLPISDLQKNIFVGTAEVGTASIAMKPLDYVLSTADSSTFALLKLDVQGYEYQALHGCETVLRQFKYIYCECSFVELYSGQHLASSVVDWLSERGFALKGVYNLYCDCRGLAIQADFLFVRRCTTESTFS